MFEIHTLVYPLILIKINVKIVKKYQLVLDLWVVEVEVDSGTSLKTRSTIHVHLYFMFCQQAIPSKHILTSLHRIFILKVLRLLLNMKCDQMYLVCLSWSFY